ncbi:N-acetylmuramoyl-L-alanine amidase [Oceanobacillus luteolus]|uniref:N-acetylmuramoyl-L-alanine amidase n=1 Tax=Oceanobacillus luteolus TaxID=1274358 RepID=A0ABW4HQY3_9BACI
MVLERYDLPLFFLFCYKQKSRQRDIHKHLANWLSSKNNIRDRGMKRANYHVVRETKMPSLLIEYMFIHSYKEKKCSRVKVIVIR